MSPQNRTKTNNYAFIDSQNLNLGIRSHGWRLDFKRFRVYLSDKFRVQKAFLFIGYMKKYQKMYNALQSYGYELVFKPVVNGAKNQIKGNVDAELVLWAAKKEYVNYDKAIIVTGDGDFYCLIKELQDEHKLLNLMIPNEKSKSNLLSEFSSQIIYLEKLKSKLGKK